MKTKYIVLILSIFTICLVGCNKGRCSKVTKEDLIKSVEYFDISVTINNDNYRMIKSSKGTYLYNEETNATIYQDKLTSIYYELDHIKKTKTVLNENYNMDVYLDNIYYVLTYHKTKDKLSNYSNKKSDHLGYETTTYSTKLQNGTEEFYVSKELNLCLGLHVVTESKEVKGIITDINIIDTDLSYINDYQTLTYDKTTLLEAMPHYKVEIEFNKNVYEFISSSDGYYYNCPSKKLEIYYSYEENQYYTIDSKEKIKTIITDEYDMNAYIEEVNYLLTYHLDKTLLLDYISEDSTYINRNITFYKTATLTAYEEIYVDKATNACLYFKLKTVNTEIIYKVLDFEITDADLSYLDEYPTLEKCEDLELKDKEEILSNFETYTIVLKQDNKIVTLMKCEQGMLCSFEEDEIVSAIMYDQENDIWYDVFFDSTEKSVNKDDNELSSYVDPILNLLTVHLDSIDEKFYKETNVEYLDRIVTRYIRTIVVNNTIYTQEYLIDDITGACLYQEVNLNGEVDTVIIEEMKFSADISEYLAYNETYFSWPTGHELLEGIEEIEYGTFVKGMYDEDGFNLIYTDIKDSFFKQILKDMVASGFTINRTDDYELDSYANYIYYHFAASNSLGVSMKMYYNNSDSSLIIILNNENAI